MKRWDSDIMPKHIKNKSNEIKFRSKVWVYPGMGAWRMVNLPKKESKDVMDFFQGLTRGFGSLPVNVTLGKSKWKTSIFPDKRINCYILPLKKLVRKDENIKDNNIISVTIKILI